MPLKIYKKKLDYSYTFGVFPTIELLKQKPYQVKSVLFDINTDNQQGINEIKKLCNKNNIEFTTSPKTISKLAVKENTNVIGVFSKYNQSVKNGNHVVLVNPSDMGNVGTIIRTMVGFNIENLVLIRPAVDIFDPKVIRSSMGSIFNINCEYFDHIKAYLNKYKQNTAYPFMLNGKHTLSKIRYIEPYSLIFGNEGHGLDDSFNNFENTIKINHSDKIDSLNLSVSVALSLYQQVK